METKGGRTMQNAGNRLTEGPIGRQMIRFAMPIFLGNLFQQLYNTADTLIVGNLLGNQALAAVSSSNINSSGRFAFTLFSERHEFSASIIFFISGSKSNSRGIAPNTPNKLHCANTLWSFIFKMLYPAYKSFAWFIIFMIYIYTRT